MNNPCEGNVWRRDDITFTFAADFSSITIQQNGQTVIIRGNDITDIKCLMDEALRSEPNELLQGEMLYNMTRTSKSMPNSTWN